MLTSTPWRFGRLGPPQQITGEKSGVTARKATTFPTNLSTQVCRRS